MKVAITFALALGFAATATGQVITNKITITNLQSQVFTGASLVRADDYGIIWRDGVGGGRIYFTNLSLGTIEALGISTNRLTEAADKIKKQAERKTEEWRKAREAQEVRKKELEESAAMEQKLAPARKFDAEKKADLTAIQQLNAQIEALDKELRHTQAAVSDGKLSGISHEAVERLNDMHERLDKLADQYAEKYGSKPPGISTGMRWIFK